MSGLTVKKVYVRQKGEHCGSAVISDKIHKDPWVSSIPHPGQVKENCPPKALADF